jgi:hypothetical protein
MIRANDLRAERVPEREGLVALEAGESFAADRGIEPS